MDLTYLIAEAAPAAEFNWIALLGTILTIVSTVGVGFLARYLNKETESASAEKDAAEAGTKDKLLARAKEAAYRIAAIMAVDAIPKIAAKIQSGDIKDKDQVKAMLRDLGSEAIRQIKHEFEADDIDLIAAVGRPRLESWIRDAANKYNPFKGQETATALINGGAEALLSKGFDFAEGKLKDAVD